MTFIFLNQENSSNYEIKYLLNYFKDRWVDIQTGPTTAAVIEGRQRWIIIYSGPRV